MKSSDVIKSQLFLTAWNETQGFGHLYGEMVGWAIANRVRRGMGTWPEVLSTVERYRAHVVQESKTLPNLWDSHAVLLMQQTDSIYDNVGRDLANGGIFYCFSNQEVTAWFKEAVIGGEYSRKASMNELMVFG